MCALPCVQPMRNAVPSELLLMTAVTHGCFKIGSVVSTTVQEPTCRSPAIGDRVAVAYRIDDNDPMISEWRNDIGTGLAYVGLSRATYSKLANAKTIALQLFFKSAHREESIVTIFKAVKTPEAIRPILAACPIEDAPEKSTARPFGPNEPHFQEPGAFVEEWKESNEACQNGNSTEKPTADACEKRLYFETKLKSLGCSFNHAIGEWACKE